MRLNLSSLSFNIDVESGGGTPAWGTELGQGEGYKFLSGLEPFLTAMLYKSVPDISEVYCPLGKGGNQADDYDFVVASLFDKVFVNGQPLDDAKFLLLITRKNTGVNHVGRMQLKYNPRMTYKKVEYNKECFNSIAEHLGLSPDTGAWFIDEITTKNQDELHFKALVGGDEPIKFATTNERKRFYLDKVGTQDEPIASTDERDRFSELSDSRQVIFYGAPGTGKSHEIKKMLVEIPQENIFRTTFHPDSDYATFVGAYKPTMKEQSRYSDQGVRINHREKDEKAQVEKGDPIVDRVIEYDFIPQAFLKAYVRAYQVEEPVYLVIEEINRGNCAQIFGDLFQLLDREESGESEYPIKADDDIKRYLEEELGEESEGIKNGELKLPNNLYIWATMNTSDQSLFPIDSAFKRRWEWEYKPIQYNNKGWRIELGNNSYFWVSFQRIVNEKIFGDTQSEDKMLGDFFVKPSDGVITMEVFRNKILFYLWNDVCKDGDADIFRANGEAISFSQLFDSSGQQSMIDIMEELKVQRYDSVQEDPTDTEEGGDVEGGGQAEPAE